MKNIAAAITTEADFMKNLNELLKNSRNLEEGFTSTWHVCTFSWKKGCIQKACMWLLTSLRQFLI